MGIKLPTERQVLRSIYDMYEAAYTKQGPSGVFMPIDIHAVAAELKCKPELLHGYLYYHLDHKYGYPSGENARVHLFAQRAGEMRHAINFPYLVAILAAQEQEHSKYAWPLGVSLAALALSLGAIVAQVWSANDGPAAKHPVAQSPPPAPSR